MPGFDGVVAMVYADVHSEFLLTDCGKYNTGWERTEKLPESFFVLFQPVKITWGERCGEGGAGKEPASGGPEKGRTSPMYFAGLILGCF